MSPHCGICCVSLSALHSVSSSSDQHRPFITSYWFPCFLSSWFCFVKLKSFLCHFIQHKVPQLINSWKPRPGTVAPNGGTSLSLSFICRSFDICLKVVWFATFSCIYESRGTINIVPQRQVGSILGLSNNYVSISKTSYVVPFVSTKLYAE